MQVWKAFEEINAEVYQLFDCRNIMDQLEDSYLQFNQGHVKGAVFVPAYPLLYDRNKPAEGRHPLPDMALFHSFVAFHCQGKIPVCYDVDHGIMGSRFYFLCDYLGLECYMTHVPGTVLTEKSEETIASLQAALKDMPLLKTETDEDKIVGRFDVMNPQDNTVIIDAREHQRFIGETEPIDTIAGHIPRAVNFHYLDAFHEDGLNRLAALTDGKEAYVYCGSGLSATPLYAALKEMNRPVKLYPGSYSEWIYHYPDQIESGE